MKSVQKISETTQDRILEMDLSAELKHGVVVSNLAYGNQVGFLGETEGFEKSKDTVGTHKLGAVE